MRAGFQVYTPRSRAQPGETLAAKGTFAPARSEAADGAEEGTPVPSTEEQEQMEIGKSCPLWLGDEAVLTWFAACTGPPSRC